jgi:hypothetical protein
MAMRHRMVRRPLRWGVGASHESSANSAKGGACRNPCKHPPSAKRNEESRMLAKATFAGCFYAAETPWTPCI